MEFAIAGVAIALQEMFASFFAWFVIRGAKGYRIGDWIRAGEHYGEVVDIGLFVTYLAQVSPFDPSGPGGGGWTGGLTVFPNSIVFKKAFVNYSRGYPYIWCTLHYTITYESDWKKAEHLLLAAAGDDEIKTTARRARRDLEKMATDFAIKVDNTEPRVRTLTGASGVELKLRFLAHPRRRRALMEKINRQIMETVGVATDVEFAYETIRLKS